VEDPYRWLEDPDGADTVKWVEAQVKVRRRGDNWLEQAHGMREGKGERESRKRE
jgi:prolyl oligopeptidase